MLSCWTIAVVLGAGLFAQGFLQHGSAQSTDTLVTCAHDEHTAEAFTVTGKAY